MIPISSFEGSFYFKKLIKYHHKNVGPWADCMYFSEFIMSCIQLTFIKTEILALALSFALWSSG